MISTKIFSIFATSKLQFMKKILFLCIALLSAASIEAKVSLPRLFQSGMVLQRGKPMPVWGKADAGETVTIVFNKKQ